MRCVLVVGIPGAGKSTFARALAGRTGLPLIHLDQAYWQPGWVETPSAAWRAKVMGLIAGEAWIMDGNYAGTLDLRVPRADAVFWFDFSRAWCLARVLWRIATTRGQVRADMAAGCPERLDLEFLRYVWRFNANERPRTAAQLAAHGQHVRPVMFRHDADVAQFLAGLS